MNPPMPYFGGKQRIAGKIVATFPPNAHYVEPFAGGLSVFFAKEPSELETLNDLDGEIVTFWRVLRDRPDDLKRVCALTPHARSEKDAAFDQADNDLERARRVWTRLAQGRASTAKKTGWRSYTSTDTASNSYMADYLEAYLGRMTPCALRLKRAQIECAPAIEIIDRYGKSESTLIYADPPYLSSLRTNPTSYAHEMSDDDHRELAHHLNGITGMCALSGYESDLYDDLYRNWNKTVIKATTGNGAAGRKARAEVLWTNYDIQQEALL